MNKAPQPAGPPPAPSPGLPQVIREELAEPGGGGAGGDQAAGQEQVPTLWIFPPPSVSGQSAVSYCQIETGPFAAPRGCHGEGGMWTAEVLVTDLLPLLYQLGFLSHPGFPSC